MSRRQLGMVVGRTKFLFLLDLFVGTARFRAEVAEVATVFATLMV